MGCVADSGVCWGGMFAGESSRVQPPLGRRTWTGHHWPYGRHRGASWTGCWRLAEHCAGHTLVTGWQVAQSLGRSLGWAPAYVQSMTQCQGANVHARRRLWGLWGNPLAPRWQIQKMVVCLGTCPQCACVREWLSVYTAPPSQLDDAGSRARVGLHLRARGPASAPRGSHGAPPCSVVKRQWL